MLYKDGLYYVDYMLENDEIHTYRYVPCTAVDGLWCSPFIRNPQSDIIESDAVKLRLRNCNPSCVSPSVSIQFEKNKLKTAYIDTPTYSIIHFLFNKNDEKK
jgi:hypothetical protein